MVLFALSCFGLLLFLWLGFGGPVPLKPKGYEFKVAFPEAAQLGRAGRRARRRGEHRQGAREDLDPRHRNRTVATIEVDSGYAPIAKDARAILRQKTLLGETFVELTPGHARAAGTIPDGGMLADAPGQGHGPARRDLRRARPAHPRRVPGLAAGGGKGDPRATARTSTTRSGTLPAFADDGTDLLRVLDGQKQQTQALIRNTGVVFGALTQDERKLHDLIVTAGQTFDATARAPARRWPTRSRSSRRSSTSRSSRSPGWRRSRRRPTRWSRTCGPRSGRGPDAARRARARARPAPDVHEPRPAHHGVEDRPARDDADARRHPADARRAAAVPRGAQPRAAVPRVPPARHGGLHLQRRGDARPTRCRPRPRTRSATTCASSPRSARRPSRCTRTARRRAAATRTSTPARCRARSARGR